MTATAILIFQDVAAIFLLITFKLQHSGASKAAKTQRILGIASLAPLLIVGIVPFVTGDVPAVHLWPLLPLGHDAQGNVTASTFGSWNGAGITMAFGAMFMAGWAAYGFETAVCVTLLAAPAGELLPTPMIV